MRFIKGSLVGLTPVLAPVAAFGHGGGSGGFGGGHFGGRGGPFGGFAGHNFTGRGFAKHEGVHFARHEDHFRHGDRFRHEGDFFFGDSFFYDDLYGYGYPSYGYYDDDGGDNSGIVLVVLHELTQLGAGTAAIAPDTSFAPGGRNPL
jgi:hypothetical protein